jgi:hypothetical protein
VEVSGPYVPFKTADVAALDDIARRVNDRIGSLSLHHNTCAKTEAPL